MLYIGEISWNRHMNDIKVTYGPVAWQHSHTCAHVIYSNYNVLCWQSCGASCTCRCTYIISNMLICMSFYCVRWCKPAWVYSCYNDQHNMMLIALLPFWSGIANNCVITAQYPTALQEKPQHLQTNDERTHIVTCYINCI